MKSPVSYYETCWAKGGSQPACGKSQKSLRSDLAPQAGVDEQVEISAVANRRVLPAPPGELEASVVSPLRDTPPNLAETGCAVRRRLSKDRHTCKQQTKYTSFFGTRPTQKLGWTERGRGARAGSWWLSGVALLAVRQCDDAERSGSDG
jgi:hypothetical protein